MHWHKVERRTRMTLLNGIGTWHGIATCSIKLSVAFPSYPFYLDSTAQILLQSIHLLLQLQMISTRSNGVCLRILKLKYSQFFVTKWKNTLQNHRKSGISIIKLSNITKIPRKFGDLICVFCGTIETVKVTPPTRCCNSNFNWNYCSRYYEVNEETT